MLAGQDCGCHDVDLQCFYPMKCTQQSSVHMTYSMTVLTGLYCTTHELEQLSSMVEAQSHGSMYLHQTESTSCDTSVAVFGAW